MNHLIEQNILRMLNITYYKLGNTISEQSVIGAPNYGMIDTAGAREITSGLPLDYYAGLQFIRLRKNEFTENDIKDKSKLDYLSKMLCNKSKNEGTCDPSKWKNKDWGYHDMTIRNPDSKFFGKTSFTYDDHQYIAEWLRFIGNSYVSQGGSGWILTDSYNFDNISKIKPWLAEKKYFLFNMWSGILKTILSPTAGIEEILSQYHNLGYPGFKVKLNVPLNGCKCQSKTTTQPKNK
jgi:hypothetical protein